MKGRRLLVALDVDGTLLRSDQSASARLRRALARARADGHTLVVATGRRRKTALAVAELLGLRDMPIVVCDGAVAFARGSDAEPILATPLPREAVAAAQDWARREGRLLALYTADDIYLSENRLDRTVRRIFASVLRRRAWRHPFGLRVAWLDLRHRPQFWPLDEPPPFPVYKGYLIDGGVGARAALAPLVDFTMPPGAGDEFVAHGVTKASGVEALLQAEGLGWEDVVAFGDNWNDLALLRRARIGFLMGNAPRALKDLYPRRTLSADEDGVAHVLEHLDEFVDENSPVVDS